MNFWMYWWKMASFSVRNFIGKSSLNCPIYLMRLLACGKSLLTLIHPGLFCIWKWVGRKDTASWRHLGVTMKLFTILTGPAGVYSGPSLHFLFIYFILCFIRVFHLDLTCTFLSTLMGCFSLTSRLIFSYRENLFYLSSRPYIPH